MATSMAFAACGNPEVKTNALSSPNDVYGMGAVSSVKLLGSTMSANAVKTLSAVRTTTKTYASDVTTQSSTPDDSEQEVKKQTEKFNEYFTALDSFLGEDVVSTTEENTDSAYAYETKMTISGKDFNGETVVYTMYYTETLVNAVLPDGEENEDEDKSEETESEYQLVGVMVVDSVDYHLEGERSVETEQDESETELKIRAYADITDKTSYIQMEKRRPNTYIPFTPTANCWNKPPSNLRRNRKTTRSKPSTNLNSEAVRPKANTSWNGK